MSQTQIQILTHIVDLGSIYTRQGPSYTDERAATVVALRGKLAIAPVEHFDAGYPYRRGWHHVYAAVTPDTEFVAIRIARYDNTVDPPEHAIEYYVYIRGYGWWVFRNNDAQRLSESKAPENAEWIEVNEKGELPLPW